MLVLILMAQLFVEQYLFYKDKVLNENFTELEMQIFSDRLSGDNNIRQFSLIALENMVNPSQFEPLNITLTSSPQDEQLPGDFLVDNLAGWLNEAISNPSGYFASKLLNIPHISEFLAWYKIEISKNRINKLNVLLTLQ